MPSGRVPHTTIYLVRHAHADWRPDEDRPLSVAGMTSAQTVASLLADRLIVAVYSSPSRRALQTVTPLAERLGLQITIEPDLREREIPPVPARDFERVIAEAWSNPDRTRAGEESTDVARTRGLGVLTRVMARHGGQQVVMSTHGNLLTLILGMLDPDFGYDFWRRLSRPDVYELKFDTATLRRVVRLWSDDAS